MKITIDPGHGEKGNPYPPKPGFFEGTQMWKLAQYLGDELRWRGFEVTNTRLDVTDEPSVAARGGVAAQNGSIAFISLHSNAADTQSATGSEVFYSVKGLEHKILAEKLANAVSGVMDHVSRGAKIRRSDENPTNDYYGVIRSAANGGCICALLIEHGFHTNPKDAAFLTDDENLKFLARIEADVIAAYFRAQTKANPPAATQAVTPTEPGLTPIEGAPVATAEQMRAYIQRINPNAPDVADIFIAEGIREGIRGDIAFAQSCLETGNFTYQGSAVTADQHNYCGMGVTANGLKGNSFPSAEIGVRAQIQHLKAYANTEPIKGEIVSPRLKYVRRGVAPYVEYLGIQENPQRLGWASGKNYGAKILHILGAILAMPSTGEAPKPAPVAPVKSPEEVTVDNALADGIITDRAHWLGVLTGTIPANRKNIRALMDKAHTRING